MGIVKGNHLLEINMHLMIKLGKRTTRANVLLGPKTLAAAFLQSFEQLAKQDDFEKHPWHFGMSYQFLQELLNDGTNKTHEPIPLYIPDDEYKAVKNRGQEERWE